MRVLAGIIVAGLCQAQLSSTISLNNGVRLQVSANLGQPTGQETLTVEMGRASGNSFYRIFWDQNHLAVFAYELAVDLTANGASLRVTARPVETEFAGRFPNADAGKPVPTLSSDHALGPLASGQSAKLDLFEIPGMGLNVSETIRVTFGAETRAGSLRFTGLRVLANGKPVGGPATGAASGRYAMFYIPGSGGYFFSTEQVAGRDFTKAGSIDGVRMRFNIENVDYECVSTSAITGDTGGELWVLHDASYKPDGTWTRDREAGAREQFFTAASDSLGWWLP